MTISIHPVDLFKNESPSLTYIWKWLKNILNNYMQLKVYLYLQESTLR